jgi:hypothetical protein
MRVSFFASVQIHSPALPHTGGKDKPDIGQNQESVLFSSQENGNTKQEFSHFPCYDLAP